MGLGKAAESIGVTTIIIAVILNSTIHHHILTNQGDLLKPYR
jgi:hypothetical protein